MTTTEATTDDDFPTVADAMNWRASPIVNDMFAGIGTPTLEQTIAEGRLVDTVEPDELQKYAAMAAYALRTTPRSCKVVWNMMMHRMFVVFVGDAATHYREVDGEPAYLNDDGSVTVVTDHLLRHWEWLFMLTSHERAARALLDAVPESMRAEAERRVRDGLNDEFGAIVANLKGGDQ